jgi:hypothetical protein
MQRRGQLRHTKRGIPQENLTSEWKLEETSGSTFYDSVGTNHGTDADIPNLTTAGKVGNGFNWASTYGSSVVPYSSDFEYNDGVENKPFSYCFWIYRTAGGSLIRLIDRTNVLFFGTVQNLIRVEYRNNANTQFAKSATNTDGKGGIESNQWIHLAFTFEPVDASNNTVKIYKNGLEIATSGNTTGQIRNNITPDLNIGGNSFSGIMDEIKFYKRALTASEISAIYNAEK